MKTIKFYTLGCKVNQYDTQSIRERFINKGFKELSGKKPAGLYVINTCTVTNRADSESLGLIRKARRENPHAEIMVTGCLTELDQVRIKQADSKCLIVKNKDKGKIQNPGGISDFQGHTRAFLKIQDGCSNFCSYCKVPLVRGRSRSRPQEEILCEANCLVNHGFKEIVLTGINLGSYGRDLKKKISIADLLGELEKIKGLLRIRLSSIEAGDVTDGLISKISQSKKVCRHLHIPIQSGDDVILKKMNRKYCRKDYLKLVKKLKELIPGIAITTDCLVGFPGEKEKNFAKTIDLLKKILPLKVHIFPYSERPGTKAFDLGGKVDVKVVKKRMQKLERISQKLSFAYKSNFINKRMPVLIESECEEKTGFWEGYTDNYIKARIKSAKNLKNKLMQVSISG